MTKELSQKADLALSNLSSGGGLLNAEQADKFIEQLIDTPTILNQARVVGMNSPTQEINKTKFGSRILRAAEDGSGDRAIHSGSRALTAAKRSKPDTSKVTLNAKEYVAEVRLPYEVLEDNIEGEGFNETVMRMITDSVARDIEEFLIQGDTASGDADLALQDGLLELISTYTVDAVGAAANLDLFADAIRLLPTRYRRNLNEMRFFVPSNVEVDYRQAVASRQTSLGDAMMTSNGVLPVHGIPLAGVALMPTTSGILIDPRNILVGFHRQIRIETDREISEREVKIVVSLRTAFNLEEEEAAVKITNFGSI